LLVIEGDDLGTPLRLQIALEIGRHVDRSDRLAGADRAHRRRQVTGALDDAQSGGRRHLLDEGA